MKAIELRNLWLDYYKSLGHIDIGSSSLIGDGETGVLFNIAGMQPIMKYLLGEPHPSGAKRLCNLQNCVRTIDIDEVGDNRHLTFFEMMGCWSLGDYFKKEKTKWSLDFLTKKLGFDINRIACTVFDGDDNAPRDTETAGYLEAAGVKKQNIYFRPKKDNWWDVPGTINTPCGPDNEWFYITDKPACSKECNPSCDCGHFVEIGNDVYMQFKQLEGGKYEELKNKNVDCGFGFERNLMFLNNTEDCYTTDLFTGVIKKLEELTGIKYNADEKSTKAFRIIADHVRTSMMLIADEKHLKPSNVQQGYILRRLIRRAVRYANMLGLEKGTLSLIAKTYIEGDYYKNFNNLVDNKQLVLEELDTEEDRFLKTLTAGEKELNKLIEKLKQFALDNKKINGTLAFRLFDTFGFPLEMTIEMAGELGYVVDIEGFNKAFEEHRKKSGAGQTGVFKGGLANNDYETTKLHTATHLLHAGLIKVLKSECKQSGSNITPERLRLDFTFDRKLTEDEIKQVEDYVNEAIKAAVPVTMKEMSVKDAKASGAIGVFDSKYGDVVKVYTTGKYSSEICGGPHAKNTSELHHFKIIKEESSSAGVRRIKAIID